MAYFQRRINDIKKLKLGQFEDYVMSGYSDNIDKTSLTTDKMIKFNKLKGEIMVIPDGVYGTINFSVTIAKTIYKYATLYSYDEEQDFLTVFSGNQNDKPITYPSFDYIDRKLNEYPKLFDSLEIAIMTQMEDGGIELSSEINCGVHGSGTVEVVTNKRMQIVILVMFIVQNYRPNIIDGRILAVFDILALEEHVISLIMQMKTPKANEDAPLRKSALIRKLTVEELRNPYNLSYPSWREYEVIRRVNDLSINFLCSGFPIFSDSFMTKKNELVYLHDFVRSMPLKISSDDIDGMTFDLVYSLHLLHSRQHMAVCNIKDKHINAYRAMDSRIYVIKENAYVFEQEIPISPMITDFNMVIFGPESRTVSGHKLIDDLFYLNQAYQVIEMLADIVPKYYDKFAEAQEKHEQTMFEILCYKDYMDLGRALIKMSEGANIAHELECWARGKIIELINKIVNDRDLSVGAVAEKSTGAELPIQLFSKNKLDLKENPYRKTVADVYEISAPIEHHSYPYNRWPFWATYEFVKKEELENNKFELSEELNNNFKKIIKNNEILPGLQAKSKEGHP